jgi:PAS domain S-box-containing protein
MDEVKQKTILLVEDEVIIALLETKQLRKEGYKVIHTTAGEKAIQIACSGDECIDLILMDIDLGSGMNGTDAAMEILKIKSIPILFVSSHIEKDIVAKTENITSYGYVVKNSSFTVLDASIKMAFKLFDAKQALQKQVDEINDLYNNAPCGYHSIDPDGIVFCINDTELKWLGYNRDEIVGKKISDFMTQEGRKIYQEVFPVFKETGYVNNLEISYVRKDGTILPVLLTGNAIFDDEGNYTMSRSTITDNTERKQADYILKKSRHELEVHRIELEMQNEELRLVRDISEAAADKYSTLYELSPVGYFTLARDGTIIELNLSGAALLGKDRSGITGTNFKFFLPEDIRGDFSGFMDRVFTDESGISCDIIFDNSKGEQIFVHIKGIISGDGDKCFIVAFDISKLKKAHEKIKELEKIKIHNNEVI